MLAKDYRLPLTTRHTPVSSYRTQYFIAKLLPSSQPTPRFGFIVSKKVAAQAVGRNRARRRLRAVIETLLPRIKSGYDILFIVQSPTLTASPTALSESVIDFLTQKHLLT